MERNLLLSEDVLRHMTLRVEELEEGDSVMMQSKSQRSGPRRDRDGEDGDKKDAAPKVATAEVAAEAPAEVAADAPAEVAAETPAEGEA